MTTLIATVIMLGVLIFVHELGHFLFAKLLGVRVERFSIGFPPKLFGRRIGETEYVVSWIPLGGYVKMFGENPEEGEEVPPEEQHRSFAHKPVWVRFVIVLAGAGFNFLLAFLLFWGMYTLDGVPHLAPVVGRVEQGSAADRAGIEFGDRIVSMNGQTVEYFDTVWERLDESGGREITITVERNEGVRSFSLTPQKASRSDIFGEEFTAYEIGVQPYLAAEVAAVQAGMPADQAGFKPGDHITAMNGRPVRDWIDVLEGVQESGGREISVTVRRNGERVKMTMTPELVTPQDPTQASGLGDPVYRIGIERRDSTVTEEVGPLQAVYYGAEKFWQVVELTGRSVVALFKRKVSVKTVGGPILIGELAGRQAKAGVVPYISLIALISINLGILNLLPIPALDGGHLFFYIIEMVFRRPVSVPVREKAQQIGVALLILFMALVFYNDITRIVSRWVQPEPAAVEQSENPGSGHGDADR